MINMMVDFNLTDKERKVLYQLVIDKLETYYDNTDAYPVAPPLDTDKINYSCHFFK